MQIFFLAFTTKTSIILTNRSFEQTPQKGPNMNTIHQPIIPGSTICILGAGQLGKMTLQAAHQLGYHTMVWAPKGDNPAMEMATHRLICPYDDEAAIKEVIEKAAVITTEWENIPLTLIQQLEWQRGVVRPSSKVLEVAQKRICEKRTANSLGIKTTPTKFVHAEATVFGADWTNYLPGILKTNTSGYDGKGQYHVNTVEELIEAHGKAKVDCVLEKRIDFLCELSVLVARTASGNISVSDIVENTHQNGILDTTVWPIRTIRNLPMRVLQALQTEAKDAAINLAKHLELEGILCLEFFVDHENNLLFNEMAPRPHNSFHGSIEAAQTSQFEQHVRAICGLPLGKVRFHSRFEMQNLIGGTWEHDWAPALVEENSRLHLYGKEFSRPGRKVGHVTRLISRA